MMTPAELTELQRSLRDILPDPDKGVFSVLTALKQALPEQTEKYNAVFQLETRLNAINKDRIRGILSQEELELAYNRITADVLDLIDGLQTIDFDPKTAGSSVVDKAGSILYRIPHTMEVEEEHKCVVRLAFDADTVVRNIELTQDTVVKEVRVSEVMEVELIDPGSTPCFAIRRLNSVEQFLEKNDYTEWIFFVKPLVTGTMPLVLKVSVKELIQDKERIKEIVLEEVITVIAEPAPPDESTTFQNSGYAFSYFNTPAQSSSESPSKQKYVLPLVLALVVATGILAAIGMMLGLIPVPPWLGGKEKGSEDRAFWQKTLDRSTRSSFETYLLAYPDGQFTQTARFKIDSLKRVENLPKTYPHNNGNFIQENALEQDTLVPGTDLKSTKNSKKKREPEKKKNPQQHEPKPDGPELLPNPPPKNPSIPPVPVPEKAPTHRRSGFEMIAVPAGKLTIEKGDCPEGVSVQIQAFKIGKYEITQADWWNIMGKDPSFHANCPDCPVERVSWKDIQEFIQKASRKNGKRYRLPFEAEWEWAARGGPLTKGYKYAGGNAPNNVAWFNIIQEKTHEVGGKRGNELGLHDMSGNVSEWCEAPYPPYLNCPPAKSGKKTLRGGSWADNRNEIKISSKRKETPGNTDRRSGLRLVEE